MSHVTLRCLYISRWGIGKQGLPTAYDSAQIQLEMPKKHFRRNGINKYAMYRNRQKGGNTFYNVGNKYMGYYLTFSSTLTIRA
ncbi:hypothetical protein GDO86_012877 [Hymenochirus boettgeri]|uniref:Uncharacterized protein n=1 Tax=Hymenochirus boettgeri TaxID=247094 RepID=A0A8T2IUG1_9PIPI|nr:hypothetical protein GDO86_012877 [Hymenochirus boettgeri]